MQTAKLFEILSASNQFWATARIDSGIERYLLSTCLNQLESKEVVVLKGIRRSGKSTLMAQIISHLLDSGTDPTRILRVNFEEPLFSPEHSTQLLEQIYQTYRERLQPQGKCYLFLDEIQNIPDWEQWVRGRSETEEMKIFITGSSSQMLSREIGTKLTGRQVSFEVYPLSFREFLKFKDIVITNDLDYIHNKPVIRHRFRDYVRYGGFPEVVLKTNPEDKELLLKSYFEDILFRDIASHHQIRDTVNLRNLAVYLLTNSARLTSINKLKKNFTISQDKTEKYVLALLESYLVFQLQKFSYSLKSTLRAGFKPYAIDTGLRNRIAFSFSEDSGHLIENIVFCHLKQHFEEIFFLANDHEIDFAVKQGMNFTKLIQVWFEDPAITSVPDREFKFPVKKDFPTTVPRILITNDYEEVMEAEGAKIQCIPVIKFLLNF